MRVDEEAAGGRNCQFLGLGAVAVGLDTVICGELAILKRLAGVGQIAAYGILAIVDSVLSVVVRLRID